MIEALLLMIFLFGLGMIISNEMFFMTLSFWNHQIYLSAFTFVGLIVGILWVWSLFLLPIKWMKRWSLWRQKSKDVQKQNFLAQVLEALVNHNKEQYPLLVKGAYAHFTTEDIQYWVILALLQPTDEVYQKLLSFPSTVLGGIYGFLKSAKDFGNTTEMRTLLEALPEKERKVLWVRQAYLQLSYMEGDWKQALVFLEQLKQTFSKSDFIHQKACCLMMAGHIEKAYKLDSTQAPIILAYAQENPEKALKVLKKAWEIAPCWEIYQAFKKELSAKTEDEKIKETLKFVKSNRGNRFSVLALADMNMTIHNFSKAKEILQEYLESHPLTQQVALMMAECERSGWHHEEAASKWERKALNLQDKSGWICTHCGHTSTKWEALCPACHLFDVIRPN